MDVHVIELNVQENVTANKENGFTKVYVKQMMFKVVLKVGNKKQNKKKKDKTATLEKVTAWGYAILQLSCLRPNHLGKPNM